MNNLQEQLQPLRNQSNLYKKEHKTFDEQLKLLKDRDLVISNDVYVLTKLQHINYYRLSAYFLPDTTFEDIINLRENLQVEKGFIDDWEDLEIWK